MKTLERLHNYLFKLITHSKAKVTLNGLKCPSKYLISANITASRISFFIPILVISPYKQRLNKVIFWFNIFKFSHDIQFDI